MKIDWYVTLQKIKRLENLIYVHGYISENGNILTEEQLSRLYEWEEHCKNHKTDANWKSFMESCNRAFARMQVIISEEKK